MRDLAAFVLSVHVLLEARRLKVQKLAAKRRLIPLTV